MLNFLLYSGNADFQSTVTRAVTESKHTLDVTESFQNAVDLLGNTFISLVIIDFNLPEIKCRALIEFLLDHYPDISVIAFSKAARPQKDLPPTVAVFEGGTDFSQQEIQAVIKSQIQNLIQGGTITNVSPPSFAQLLEMEGKTCILRILEKDKGGGLLVFDSGSLIDARFKEYRAEEAACMILGWDEADIYIQNRQYPVKHKITTDLKSIIVRSVHLKDKAGTDHKKDLPPQVEHQTFKDLIEYSLAKQLGRHGGIEGIFHDQAAQLQIDGARPIGELFTLGKLKIMYADDGTQTGLIVDGPVPAVVKINAQTPVEKTTMIISQFLDTL